MNQTENEYQWAVIVYLNTKLNRYTQVEIKWISKDYQVGELFQVGSSPLSHFTLRVAHVFPPQIQKFFEGLEGVDGGKALLNLSLQRLRDVIQETLDRCHEWNSEPATLTTKA